MNSNLDSLQTSYIMALPFETIQCACYCSPGFRALTHVLTSFSWKSRLLIGNDVEYICLLRYSTRYSKSRVRDILSVRAHLRRKTGTILSAPVWRPQSAVLRANGPVLQFYG